MLLVGLRHQLERELLFVAARTNVGPVITHDQYVKNVAEQRERLRRDGWKNLIAMLNLDAFAGWETSMETLRLLANCVKHHPTQQPDGDLLKHLDLPAKPTGRLVIGYLPLSESQAFREGLAASVDLPKDSDYCAIAERFVDLVDRFLEGVRGANRLAQINGRVSLSQFYG